MNKFVNAFVTSVALFTSVAVANAQKFDASDRAQIEAIIDEYVSNHPEIIIRAMQKLEKDELALQSENIKKISSLIRNDTTLPQHNTAKAKHYIIEFFDFNCGYCKVLEPMFEKALKEFDLQIIYVNIPIIKDESKQLAVFAQALYNVDKKAYFKFHEHFMTPGYKSSDTDELKKLCKEYGVDFEKVVNELKTKRPQERISKSIEYGASLKVSGTPYLIIDGKELRGAFRDYSQLKDILSNK